MGKTTASAAIALGMAARGRKVAVLTIDPAKRLANSLGLRELGNEERRVDVDVDGELWAMMLDAKRTFDELIEWHAPDERTRDACSRTASTRSSRTRWRARRSTWRWRSCTSCSQEGRYDLLVLDTPPTRNALDFLDAPQKLSEFIDSRSLQLLHRAGAARPEGARTRQGRGLLGDEARHRASTCSRTCGEFFRAFGDMTDGFRERAERVERAARPRRTAFVLVTSPRRERDRGGRCFFHQRLREAGLPFGA